MGGFIFVELTFGGEELALAGSLSSHELVSQSGTALDGPCPNQMVRGGPKASVPDQEMGGLAAR